MKKIIPFILFVLFGVNVWGQNNDLPKDDSKFLKLSLLIKLAKADLLTIDQTLFQNDYTLNESSPNSDVISYKYVRYNFFSFKKFITKEIVLYKFGYTDGLYSKYSAEITELKLLLTGSPGTVLIENGIKSNYNYDDPQNNKWLISLSKINPPGGQTTIEISISPRNP